MMRVEEGVTHHLNRESYQVLNVDEIVYFLDGGVRTKAARQAAAGGHLHGNLHMLFFGQRLRSEVLAFAFQIFLPPLLRMARFFFFSQTFLHLPLCCLFSRAPFGLLLETEGVGGGGKGVRERKNLFIVPRKFLFPTLRLSASRDA